MSTVSTVNSRLFLNYLKFSLYWQSSEFSRNVISVQAWNTIPTLFHIWLTEVLPKCRCKAFPSCSGLGSSGGFFTVPEGVGGTRPPEVWWRSYICDISSYDSNKMSVCKSLLDHWLWCSLLISWTWTTLNCNPAININMNLALKSVQIPSHSRGRCEDTSSPQGQN